MHKHNRDTCSVGGTGISKSTGQLLSDRIFTTFVLKCFIIEEKHAHGEGLLAFPFV